MLTPEILEQIFQIALNVITILSAIGAAFAIKWIKNKIGTEKFKQVQEKLYIIQKIAIEACKFAEQQGIDIGVKGEEKLKIACEWMSSRLKEEKINVSPEQIEAFIKAALRTLKDTWGEEWADQIK